MPRESARPAGAWASHNEDGSGAAIFGSELAALRDAVSRGARVTHWPFGLSLTEAQARYTQEATAAAPRARRARKGAQAEELPVDGAPTPETGA